MMSPATAEVRVDGLAGDQQVHDLGRALEDAVDPQIAEHLLVRYRAFAPGRQGIRGLEAAATADLDQFAPPIRQPISEPEESLARAASMRMSLRSSSAIWEERSTTASSANVVAAMNEILGAHRLVPGHGLAPLLAPRGRPLAGDLQTPLAAAPARTSRAARAVRC